MKLLNSNNINEFLNNKNDPEGFFLEDDFVSPCWEVKIDKDNRTSEENIFSAGDISDVASKQIVIAAGQGAKAALSAYKYLNK